MRHFEREGLIWASKLDAESKLILLALNQHLGSNETAWPGVETIAFFTSLSERTVLRRLKALEEKSIIQIQRRYQLGMQTSSEYKIQWQSLGVVSITANPLLNDEQLAKPVNKSSDSESPLKNPVFSLGFSNLSYDSESLPENQGCQRVSQGVTESQSRGDRESPELIHIELTHKELIQEVSTPTAIEPGSIPHCQSASLSALEDSGATQTALFEIASSAPKKPPLKKHFTKEEFEKEWWPVNRYKVGKADALKAFLKIDAATVTMGHLKESIQKQQSDYKASHPNEDRPFQFFPHPATWLNGKRWEDTPIGQEQPQQQVSTTVPVTPSISPEEKREGALRMIATLPQHLRPARFRDGA